MVGVGWHRLGGDKEKGGRGSDGFIVGIGLGLGRETGQRGGVEWSKRVEWRGVEWSGVGRKSDSI